MPPYGPQGSLRAENADSIPAGGELACDSRSTMFSNGDQDMTKPRTTIRAVAAVLIAVPMALAVSAAADPITHHFRGAVTLIDQQSTELDLESEFTLGEMATVSVTYEGDTPEDASSTEDPISGNYTDPSLTFSVVFEYSNREFSMTASPFQIVNVIND